MRTIKKFTMFTLLFSTSIFANNLSVGNVQLVGQDATNNFTFIQFDVSWENSWRNDLTGTGQSAPFNYDAIWVFVKYKVQGEAEWKHATLNTSGYTPPTGSAIDVPSDGKGAFIYRDGNGTGTFSLSAVQLRWNYGVDGITDDNANVTVKVFAIEMVYIPTGSFHVGDGTSTDIAGHLHRADDTSVPFLISNEAQITLGLTSSANLGNNNNVGLNPSYLDDFDNSTTQILPSSYPKGHNDFYMMKYEITQGQYVDFLNCLTRNQQQKRTSTDLSAGITNVTKRYVMIDPDGSGTLPPGSETMIARNSIRCDATIPSSLPIIFYCDYNGDETRDDGKDLACNYLHWLDGSAYADWAGLRPFTELEFEKACRGTQTPTANEYGWGNIIRHSSSYEPVINPGAPNELPSNPGTNGNSAYTTTVPFKFGPLRAGIFATNSSTRIVAGASYYGVMELTGNLWETVVSLGTQEGRDFEGTHGDGDLTVNGEHNISDWPFSQSATNGQIDKVPGAGFRGGGIGGDLPWPPEHLRISDREFINVLVNFRALEDGMRLVRTAP